MQTSLAEIFTDNMVLHYGWANYAEVNLYNMHGFPASPFRLTTIN